MIDRDHLACAPRWLYFSPAHLADYIFRLTDCISRLADCIAFLASLTVPLASLVLFLASTFVSQAKRFSIQRGSASASIETASHYHPSASTTLVTSPSKAQVDDGLHLTCLGSSLPRARARFLRIRHLPASTCIDSNPSTRASQPRICTRQVKTLSSLSSCAILLDYTAETEAEDQTLIFPFPSIPLRRCPCLEKNFPPLPSFRLVLALLPPVLLLPPPPPGIFPSLHVSVACCLGCLGSPACRQEDCLSACLLHPPVVVPPDL